MQKNTKNIVNNIIDEDFEIRPTMSYKIQNNLLHQKNIQSGA